MSSSNSYSYSSATYISSSTANGQLQSGQAYMQTTSSNPTGTKVQTTSHNLGEPAIHETRYYDAEGNQILEGAMLGQGNARGGLLPEGNAGRGTNRIEEVTDEQEGGRNKCGDCRETLDVSDSS